MRGRKGERGEGERWCVCVCSGICAELASYEREEREVVCFL